jgi:organic hydroperoxide reductase OsmC/OhrA
MSQSFEVGVRWTEGLRGEALPDDVPGGVPFSVPREFGGPGGEWTPEHFLASAVGSCVLATFLSIARLSKLEVAGYESRASCAIEKAPEGFRLSGVRLEVKITVSAEKDVERAERLIEKAEKMCPISNGLKTPVAFAATVESR